MASHHSRKAWAAPLAILALVLASVLLPSLAIAAPPGGEGELTFTPSAVAFGPATVGTNTTEQPIEIHNTGTVNVVVSNVSLQGAEAGEFATGQNPCNGVTLGPGQSCTFGVYFSPHSEGVKQAQARVTSSDLTGEEDVELTGVGAPPEVTFEPGSYDFGLQSTHGEGRAEIEFQVRNSGAATVQISNIGFEGQGSNSFNTGNDNCLGAYLNPGQSCFLQIQFRPQETIAYVADLRLSAGSVNFTAALTGEGGQPVITPSLSPVAFGAAAVGSPGLTQTITLTNHGDLPGGFFIAFLTGGDVADFQLLSEDCTSVQIDPNSTCSAKVRFRPSSSGAKSAKLSFIEGGEGGPLQIDLNGVGTGVGSALTLGPGALSFGTQAIGSSSQSQSVTLTNGGSSPIEVDSASILGPGSDQFRLGDSCSGVALAPGASCQAAVRFSPVSEGAASATLRILAGGQKLTAQLSGNAVAPAQVRLRLGSKLPQAKDNFIAVGKLACDAASSCDVRIRATVSAAIKTGDGNRVRNVALPSRRLQVAAGATPTLRLRLGADARGLLADRSGAAHLNLRFSWSSEGRSGSSGIRRQVR